MEQWVYLGTLLLSISGLLLLDWRHKLAFWYDAKRTSITMVFACLLFLLWDIIGISLGIFLHGNSSFSLPYRLFPEFPIEELFFLFLLSYVTLMLYRGAALWRRTS